MIRRSYNRFSHSGYKYILEATETSDVDKVPDAMLAVVVAVAVVVDMCVELTSAVN